MEFFGRQEEISALRRIRSIATENARMTVLTGRRRVGKTALVRKALDDGKMPYVHLPITRQPEVTLCEQLQAECEDVLHLCYSDVEHWDYATLMGYFDAYRLQRVSGGGATDGNTSDGEMPIVFLLVGEGKSYEMTLQAMGEYNGIYYELNGGVYAICSK